MYKTDSSIELKWQCWTSKSLSLSAEIKLKQADLDKHIKKLLDVLVLLADFDEAMMM